jgi:hypothetical protein
MFFDVQASPRNQQGNCLSPPKIFKKLFNKKSQISLPKKKKKVSNFGLRPRCIGPILFDIVPLCNHFLIDNEMS